MIKNILKLLVILIITTTPCFAKKATAISTINDVQCNRQGWQAGGPRVVWSNDCAPLQVKSRDGKKVYSIANTAKYCHEGQYPLFYFYEGENRIWFDSCYDVEQSAKTHP